MADETYVTNAAWAVLPGRPDAIDEIADQFERCAPGAATFWADVTARRLERDSAFTSRTVERRAG